MVQKKRNGLMPTSVKDTLVVVGLIMARPFYTILGKETVEVVGLILERPFLYHIRKYTLEVVGSILARIFYKYAT